MLVGLPKSLGVQWHPLAGMIRNENIMKPSQQEQVDGIWMNLIIWCLLYHDVYLCLSMHLTLQIEGVQLTGQREASKSVFRGRIQVDRRQGCGRRRVIIGACARVLECPRFRLRLTLFCNIFFCNFLYTFVQSVAICCSSSTVTGWFSCCCKNGGPQEDRRMLHMPHLKFSLGVPTCPGGPNSYNWTQHDVC